MHKILIGMIFALLFMATAGRLNSNGVKQQVLEKQLALLIDSAVPDMTFIVNKANVNGVINNLEVKEGKIFAYIGSQTFSKGYPYFTKYNVNVEKQEDKFLIRIK